MEVAYALYRVSTKKQVDKQKDDIPMQREACREFAGRMDWQIGKEFLEKGVSGFKVSAENRDAIQDLKNAALAGEFQILLVYMFDRIGRIDDETPFVVEWFVKHGIKVWSVQEGEQRFESHVDKLMNYIRFWQASGESEKTSMRIKTRMQQLTAEGSYTGGPVPFGYKLVKNGRLNKRGKEISDLAIDENEIEWVRKIFELTVDDGYGSYRVASFLNDKGVRTHNGAKFQSITIIRILRNKLYCGYIVSGETVSPHMQELQIIDKDMFERARYILDQRSAVNDAEREIVMTTKGRAMLSGLMFCAHCGCRLTSNVFRDTYTRADGTTRTGEYLRYICYHKSRKLCECDGQSTYTAAKVDEAVCRAVMDIFSSVTDAPDEVALKRKYDKEMSGHKAKITKLNLEIKRYSTQLEKLNAEIADSLTGDSVYTPEQLSTAINSVHQKISDANAQLEAIQNEIENQKASMEKVRPNYDRFIGWAGEFASATVERKKMIISQLVKRIEISKGYKINIEMNMDYEQFCEGWNGLKEVVIA